MSVLMSKRQSGVALLEVLIAIVVVAIGLLGLAGLQGYVMRNTNNSYYRTIATMAAQDMADRVRANQVGQQSNAYSTMTNPDSAVDPGCINAGCNVTQLAQYDFWRWNRELKALLPSGKGVICRDASANDGATPADPQCDGAGNFLVIKVWWDDRKDVNNLQRFTTVVLP